MDDDFGMTLALPAAGLIAASDSGIGLQGLAEQALVVAGQVLGQEVKLGKRAGRKQSAGICEE